MPLGCSQRKSSPRPRQVAAKALPNRCQVVAMNPRRRPADKSQNSLRQAPDAMAAPRTNTGRPALRRSAYRRGLSAPVPVADTSALAFVGPVYDNYIGEDVPTVPLDNAGAAFIRKRTSAANLGCLAGQVGAGEGNRTLVISLEGFCSTIELHPRIARYRDTPAK
jgi:hypothetical protein